MLKPVVMITGDEEALRRRALNEIIERAQGDGDFDLQVLDADEKAPEEWFASAGTAPFLADRRTVVVRHLLRVGSPTEILDKNMAALPPTALLVLVADDEMGDENKQRKFASARKAWEAHMPKLGGAVLAFNANPKGAQFLLKQEIEQRGKRITADGLRTLDEMVGGNLSRGIEEIDKLFLYVGEQKQISHSDVRQVVLPSREWQVFKLIDAIVNGEVGPALEQVRILVGSPTKAEEAAFRNLLPQMSRQLRLVWQARICVEQKLGIDAAAHLFPDNPNLAKLPDWQQQKAFTATRRADFEQLAKCMRLVSDADARLKGMLPAFSAMETLEQLVLEMAEVLGPTKTR